MFPQSVLQLQEEIERVVAQNLPADAPGIHLAPLAAPNLLGECLG
jgi:hypothetical protein